MSKHWYPQIDLSKCNQCGACIRKCTHGVYDRLSNIPVVVFPDGCVAGCHGCQDRCKTNAISYVGETDMRPATDGSFHPMVRVEYLFLDDRVCSRCASTKDILTAALETLRSSLTEAGYTLSIESIHIDSLTKAEQYRLLSSPTIRVNGVDLAPVIFESDCPDCGTLCGTEMMCRDWMVDGSVQTVPTKALLMRLILNAVCSDRTAVAIEAYEMPASIRRFFTERDA